MPKSTGNYGKGFLMGPSLFAYVNQSGHIDDLIEGEDYTPSEHQIMVLFPFPGSEQGSWRYFNGTWIPKNSSVSENRWGVVSKDGQVIATLELEDGSRVVQLSAVQGMGTRNPKSE